MNRRNFLQLMTAAVAAGTITEVAEANEEQTAQPQSNIKFEGNNRKATPEELETFSPGTLYVQRPQMEWYVLKKNGYWYRIAAKVDSNTIMVSEEFRKRVSG